MMDTLEMPAIDPARVTWHHVDEPGRSHSPKARPPAAVRVFAGLSGIGASVVTAALLLSDRAPGLLQMAFGDRARDLWQRIDSTERVNLPPTADIPPTDFLAHVAIWAVVATLVGLAAWTWRGLATAAIVLGGASLVLELAQGRYATARTVQAADAVANLIGVSLGITAAGTCYLVWSLGAAVAGALRGSPGVAATNLNSRCPGSLR